MAVSAAGRVIPCIKRTSNSNSKLGAKVKAIQLIANTNMAIFRIVSGFRLAKNKPYTKGAIASGNIVAVIKLPAVAGDTEK